MPSRALLVLTGVLASCRPAATSPEPSPSAPPRWSAAEIADDVALLRRAYGALHPGLHRYLDDAALDDAYARLTRELGEAPTLGAGHVALARFTAAIRCGHTFPNPANQDDAVQAALFEGLRLPVLLRWLDGEAVVTRALTGDGALAPGTRIVRFDGVPAAEVLARLVPLVPADGANDGKRVATLAITGDERFETFDLLYPPVFGLGATARLEVVRPGGARATVEVATMTAAARRAATEQAAADDEPSAAWALRELAPGVRYLAMPTWVMYRGARDWRGDLTRIFTGLAGGDALIIDLRGNGGGDDVGDAIIAHLIERPLAVEDLERRVRYRRVPDELRPALTTWDASFFDWGDDAVPIDEGWYHLRGDDDDDEGRAIVRPAAPRFAGAVLVLVDAANSSATFQFAARVQRHRLATLVGEPTGGNQRGINGGAFFFLRLPHLGLEVDLPLIGRFPREAVPDAGIVPDVVVPVTAGDVAAGRDPQLAAALALAARR